MRERESVCVPERLVASGTIRKNHKLTTSCLSLSLGFPFMGVCFFPRTLFVRCRAAIGSVALADRKSGKAIDTWHCTAPAAAAARPAPESCTNHAGQSSGSFSPGIGFGVVPNGSLAYFPLPSRALGQGGLAREAVDYVEVAVFGCKRIREYVSFCFQSLAPGTECAMLTWFGTETVSVPSLAVGLPFS